MVLKTNAQSNEKPNEAPALDAVIIVPGPINAADSTDQSKMLRIRLRKEVCRAVMDEMILKLI